MPKRKHTKKKPVVPCTDANQRAKESIIERARIAKVHQKKMEEMRARYIEEMKKREEEKKKTEESSSLISPTATPVSE
jgi:hypothetical protein